MARILWLTAEVPDTGMGGGNIRQAHLLDATAAIHDVDLVVVGQLRDEHLRAQLAELHELEVPPIRHWSSTTRRRAHDLWHGAVQRQPAEVVDQAIMRSLLEPYATTEAAYDIVCIEQIGLVPLLPRVRTARWAATLHYLPSIQADQVRSLSPGRAARWLWGREAEKARRLELWAATHFDLVSVCSDDDATRLPGACVVPNGVDLARFPVTPVPRDPRLVITATLGYLPNVDGVRWVCEEVLPVIRAARPDVQLEVVGRHPTAEVRQILDAADVALHADVDSVVPHLLDSRIALVPLRIGAGTRLKALEAFAAARPVVGTAIGLAGLELVDGVHARIADDATEFARACLDLLQDDATADRLAAAGRALVEERYDWEGIGATYARRLAELADSSS